MRSHELARLLLSKEDMPVEVGAPDRICSLWTADIDCFDEETGLVWVLDANWNE